jgi:hypothetical protein
MLVAEDVDGLEDRQPAASPQNPVKLAKRGSLVHEEDQDRARRDDVDGSSVKRKRVRRCPDEVASVGYSELSRKTSAFSEQIFGNVAEDDAPVPANLFECRERNQPISRPDVEDDISLANLGVRNDAHSEFVECGKHPFELLLVASVAAFEQPLRPPVARRTHYRSSSRYALKSGGSGDSASTRSPVNGCAKASRVAWRNCRPSAGSGTP